MQTAWAQQLNPLLSNPALSGLILSGVVLGNGTSTINHKLGRKLQGWFIVGINAVAAIYDQQASNQMADKTLVLVSNAACTVNLYVF